MRCYFFFHYFSPARNVVEAASNGAMDAIKVVASVAANLIAILGLIAFLNALLSYFGARVGFPQLTFQVNIFLVKVTRQLTLQKHMKIRPPTYFAQLLCC